MKRAMLAAVCLLMLLMTTAGVSAAAGAEPAFYECVKLKGGKYKGGCREESAKGAAELAEGIGTGKRINWKSSTFSPFAPAINGGKLECTKVKMTGALAGTTTFKGLHIVESNCFGGTSRFCTSIGQPPHTVDSGPLEGTLGYIDAAEHRVGLDLHGEGGADLFDYNCEGLEEQVGGSVIGEITPVNAFTNAYSISFARDGEGFQSIKKFEGQPEDVPQLTLNGSGPFSASLEARVTLKGGKLELKG
jgi:hypothetical protein